MFSSHYMLFPKFLEKQISDRGGASSRCDCLQAPFVKNLAP